MSDLTQGSRIHRIRHGGEQPLPQSRNLFAGPVEVQFEDGNLRYINLGGIELIRGIYAAVRDKSWGTIPPKFASMEIADGGSSFRISFTAEHVYNEIDFVWQGVIEGSPDGTIVYTMEGRARTSFLKNRIGFCILHPIHLAGTPVEYTTPDGAVQGSFPERIDPNNPFLNMTAMRYPAAPGLGLDVSIQFEGDLFETEDQRNWTDASYKTFCTPLGLPYPVEIKANTIIKQSVTVKLVPTTGADLGHGPVDAKPHEQKVMRIQDKAMGKLPPIGLGYAPLGRALTETEINHLQLLNCAHYHLKLDLLSADWKDVLDAAHLDCSRLGAALELEVIADDQGGLLQPFIQHMASQNIRAIRMKCYPGGVYVTPQALIDRARVLANEYGLQIAIGCGTRANFAEFNRAGMPQANADYAFYSINPQTHAFDIASIAETLEAQPVTANSAKAIVQDMPLHVGPITLKPRVNPVAAGPEEANWHLTGMRTLDGHTAELSREKLQKHKAAIGLNGRQLEINLQPFALVTLDATSDNE